MSMPPQVRDEEWFTRFKAELQLRGATGREIGEAVAEVDQHCRESSERAPEAFGDPLAYAASLRDRPVRWTNVMARHVAPLVAFLLAMQACLGLPLRLTGTTAVLWGGIIYLTFWTLAGVLLLVSVSRQSRPRHALVFFLVLMGANLLTQWTRDAGLPPAFHAPVWAGWLLLLASVLFVVRSVRRAIRNRQVDPRTGTDDWALPGWVWAPLPFVLPLFVAGVLLLRWAVR